jgi:mono/diheme cytochrome c family protein
MANPSRNTIFGLIILCGAIAAAASPQTGTQPAQKEQSSAATAGTADLANGKAVYTKSCQKCHAADGKGNPSIARMQKVTLRPLGAPEILAKSDAELIKESTQGTGKMKAVQLSDKDAQDVVAYLRTFKEEKK